MDIEKLPEALRRLKAIQSLTDELSALVDEQTPDMCKSCLSCVVAELRRLLSLDGKDGA